MRRKVLLIRRLVPGTGIQHVGLGEGFGNDKPHQERIDDVNDGRGVEYDDEGAREADEEPTEDRPDGHSREQETQVEGEHAGAKRGGSTVGNVRVYCGINECLTWVNRQIEPQDMCTARLCVPPKKPSKIGPISRNQYPPGMYS